MAKRKKLILYSCGTVVAVLVIYVLAVLTSQYIAVRPVRSAMKQEYGRLEPALEELGIQNPQGIDSNDCTAYRNYGVAGHETVCISAALYKYNFTPLEAADHTAHQQHAAALDKLLTQDGWQLDRPHDEFTLLTQIDPFSSANKGEGGTIPYHKNIGNISCNLDIMMSDETGVGQSTLNVNAFSCSRQYQSILLFWLTPQSNGGG